MIIQWIRLVSLQAEMLISIMQGVGGYNMDKIRVLPLGKVTIDTYMKNVGSSMRTW